MKVNFDLKKAAQTLKITEAKLLSQINALISADCFDAELIIKRPEGFLNDLPEYSQEDIILKLENDKTFNFVVNHAQDLLGKALNVPDLRSLLRIYEWFGFSPDIIVMLITYCISEEQIRKGAERKPTFRAIEKEAVNWQKNGISDVKKVSSYIKERDKLRNTDISHIVNLLKLIDYSKSDEEIIAKWAIDKVSDDIILNANKITAQKTNSQSIPYMNKVIQNTKKIESSNNKNTHREVNSLLSSRRDLK